MTLAANDNYFFGDPLLSHRFEQAGDYLLEIRDVRYEGNAFWEYCIEANWRPFVETVFPLAVARGQTAGRVGGISVAGGADDRRCTPPTDRRSGLSRCVCRLPGPYGPRFGVGHGLDAGLEAAVDNNSPEKAQPLPIPAGVNGRIESEADVDYYAFEAKKGEALSFEIVARRQRSRLDSYLRVLNDKGQQLASNDDLRQGKRNHSDSWIENRVAPADGQFILEVRDVHLRGGPTFPYFLQVNGAGRILNSIWIPTRHMSPGGCGVIYCRVERKSGFTGPVDLHVEGLPARNHGSCGRILGDKSQDGCIVLEADHDAPSAVGE